MSVAAVTAIGELGGPPVARVLAHVEGRMAELAGGYGDVLARYAGETIAAGGKRLRPLLVCLAAGAPPPENELILCGAVAVELVHAATLVHDDVLDGSPLRRGRPTVFASGGRVLATAAGDLLFSRAFAELAATGSVQAVRVLSAASHELARGELMQREDAWDRGVTVARYLERCRLKTAVLFRAACLLGALATGEASVQLGEFGERIGLAFQLLDDILDITGPSERTGKPRGTDLLDGTVTLPLIYAREVSLPLGRLDLREVQTPGQAARVCDEIARTDALARARADALELVARAKRSLPELPDRQQQALKLVADGVVARYS